MSTPSDPKVYEVHWDDHSFKFGEYAGESVKGDICKVTTVGYLVREDKDVIVLAFSISDGAWQDTQVIDKRMFTKKRRLR